MEDKKEIFFKLSDKEEKEILDTIKGKKEARGFILPIILYNQSILNKKLDKILKKLIEPSELADTELFIFLEKNKYTALTNTLKRCKKI